MSYLDEIEARTNAASEGPWNVDDEEMTVRAREYAGEIMFDRSADGGYEWRESGRDNAEFIANARTDIPYLINLVRTQQARIATLEAAK